MTEDTPVWISAYGELGSMLISLEQVGGIIYFITEYIHNEY
jgi:ABC-type cobalt transport system substrate-binding protein